MSTGKTCCALLLEVLEDVVLVEEKEEFDEEVLSEVTLSSSESELVVFTVEAVRLEFVLSALRIRRRFFLPDEQPCPLRGSTNTVYGVGSRGKRTFRSFHTPGGHRACVHTSIRSNHSIFLLLLQPHGL